MTYISFINQKIDKIKNELKKLQQQIKSFPSKDQIEYTDYGSKKAIKREYSQLKNKKKHFFISKKSKQELNNYIYERELSKLTNRTDELNEELYQLTEVTKSFIGEEFQAEIFPNDYVVESILEYSELVNLNSSSLIKMLISLFKRLTNTEKTFLKTIEHNISEYFTDSYDLLKNINVSSLLFMLDKIFKTSCKSKTNKAYETSINSLKQEIKRRHNKQKTESSKKQLEHQKSAISELNKYIKDGQIIAPAPSVTFFEFLLEEANIDCSLRKKYSTLMEELINKLNPKESLYLIEKYLSKAEQEEWRKANEFANNLPNPELSNFIKRILQDIISICKYIEAIDIESEKPLSYEAISLKLDLIQTIMYKLKNTKKNEHTFCYVTDTNNVPILLRNIENLDILRYNDILHTLERLANGESGEPIPSVDYQIIAIDGDNIRLYYSQKDKTIAIIGVIGDKLTNDNSLYLGSNVIQSLKRIFNNNQDANFNRTQHTYEEIILHSLDLFATNQTDSNHRLLKKK